MAGERGKAAAGTLDQIFSSASNGLILLALAVVSDAAEFGQLSVVFTVFAAGVGLLRGALGTPLLLVADRGLEYVRTQGRHAVAAALLAGLVVGAAIVAYGLADRDSALWVVGLGVPLLMVQDVIRYVAIAAGQAVKAVIWDGLWFLGSAAALLATWSSPDSITPLILVAGWVGLGGLACFGAGVAMRVTPRFRGVTGWLREDGRHRLLFGIDAGLEQVGVLLVLLITAAIIDDAGAGALRGSAAMLAPFAILTAAIPLVVIPESKRQGREGHQTWAVLLKIALITGGSVFLVGLAALFVPEWVGRLVLGDTFAGARPVLTVMACEYAIGAVLYGLATYLRALKRSGDLVRLKSAHLLLTVAGATLAALIFHSAVAVALGLVTASVILLVVALGVVRPWREPDRSSAAAAVRDPEPVVDARAQVPR